VFIKYEAKVSSRVSGGERGVVDFGKLFTETNVSIFYPHDALLARIIAVALCLCVTSWSSIETAERIRLVFGMEASFDLFYTEI